MNILYLSPNFPRNYHLFPVRLREAGARVSGIGWEPFECLNPEVQGALSEYRHVPEMDDYDQVLRAAADIVSRVGKLDRVVSQEEHWIDLEAALRLDLNVPGGKPDEIRPFRKKSLMKEVFRSAGVPVARGRVIADVEEALEFVREAGYPVIAKPDQGVGAHATFKISDGTDLDEYFRIEKPDVPYIFEEFLAGFIQSFDGLTDRDGRIVFSTSHQFGEDIMSVVNNDDHLHYWSLRTLPADLEDFGRKAVAAFGLRERFFHMEFIRSPQGKLTAMEINARPPGGLTMDMFNFANDIDLFKSWSDIVVHGESDIRFSRPFHVSYIGRKANKRYVHSHEEVLDRYGKALLLHTPIDSVFRQAIGDYAYLARAPRMEELWPLVKFIHALEETAP